MCGKDSASKTATCPLNVCCSQFGFCGTTEKTRKSEERGDVRDLIIGYYESWKASGSECGTMDPSQIPVEALDQVNFAFVYITPGTYDLYPMGNDYSTLKKVADAKTRNPEAKIWLSVGGWSFNDNDTSTQPVFSDIASTSEKSVKFADKVISFMNEYGFDGIDIDWEYPGAGDRGGKVEDVANFPRMMGVLRSAFKSQSKHWGISITVPTSYWYLRWFNLQRLAENVDYFNLMAYDLHGVWDSTDPIGPYVYAHTNLTEIDSALSLFWRAPISPSRIVLGLAFYGRSFTLKDPSCATTGCEFSGAGAKGKCTKTAGNLSYREIMQIQKDNAGAYDSGYDEEAGVNYMVYKSDSRDRHYSWVSYDDKTTFQQKIDFANKRGLKGLLIWAIDQDDDSLNALKAVTGKDISARTALSKTYGEWNVEDCYITECGDKCLNNWVNLFELNLDRNSVGCPNSGKNPRQRQFCCPPWGAPDGSKCKWRGSPHECYGQCEPKEVLMALDNFAGRPSWGWCRTGQYAMCCPATSGVAAIDQCSKESGTNCPSGKPQKLTSLQNTDSSSSGSNLCCPADPVFEDCGWYGWPTTCTNNRCPEGQIEIYRDTAGDSGANCVLSRQKAFCCKPPLGGTAFLPVPLENLFAEKFSAAADPVYYEAFDHTKDELPYYDSSATDDPNGEPFAWTIFVGDQKDVQSLRKRDGSHLEAFSCPSPLPDDYSTQTVKLACMLEADDNCEDLLLGGARGTVVRLPEDCGPDEWVRAVSFKQVGNIEEHRLPSELVKRAPAKSRVYELRYDYNFRKLRRDGKEVYVRMDTSDHPGYWDAVVASKSPNRKRDDPAQWREFHMDWFHAHGFVNGSEQAHLAARGVSSDASWWQGVFNTLLGKSGKATRYGIQRKYTYSQLLYSARTTCPPSANASLTASVQGSLGGRLDFGISVVGTLRNLDFAQSYGYFKLDGMSATAGLSLDADAAIAMSTTTQPLQIPLDPWGGSFNIKGLWQVGPYVDVTAKLDARATISGSLRANATLEGHNFLWTYPKQLDLEGSYLTPNAFFDYPVIVPGKSATISSAGSLTMTLTPSVGFRVELEALGKSFVHTDIKASFGASLTALVEASTSTCAKYGLSGHLDVEVAVPKSGWSGTDVSTLVSEEYEVIKPRCYSWADPDSHNSLAKRGDHLETRATVLDPLFPDINARGIACSRDITSRSTGCGPVLLDNSHLHGVDSVDQGVVPNLGPNGRILTERASLAETSGWDDAPGYALKRDLKRLSKRKSQKPGFHLCVGKYLRPPARIKSESGVDFSGFTYWSGPELLTGKSPLPVPRAWRRAADCDTYGVQVDQNPQMGADESGWIAEHVLEWQLLNDFWQEQEEFQFGAMMYPNPASDDYIKNVRPGTAWNADPISWCNYMKFWWENKRKYTMNGQTDFPVNLAGMHVIPADHNVYASELQLLDSETNGFKERLLGDGAIRRDIHMNNYIVEDPDRAIDICRAVMNSVHYMKETEIAGLFLQQATRVANRLNDIEQTLSQLPLDPDYNKARYVPFNFGRLFQAFMYQQHSIAWNKVTVFLNEFVPALQRTHSGHPNGQQPQGGAQTNEQVVARIGLLVIEYEAFLRAGWTNPIPATWA
ncbi:glycosyl hydrolases family 18 protein-like protein [Apiospora kogelbergensis]|uniref:chitinase n=1 Tax=Apiospora kogelbergensis TaxID=1337665 RepID=A0AAW0RAV4_9PEZI